MLKKRGGVGWLPSGSHRAVSSRLVEGGWDLLGLPAVEMGTGTWRSTAAEPVLVFLHLGACDSGLYGNSVFERPDLAHGRAAFRKNSKQRLERFPYLHSESSD